MAEIVDARPQHVYGLQLLVVVVVVEVDELAVIARIAGQYLGLKTDYLFGNVFCRKIVI